MVFQNLEDLKGVIKLSSSCSIKSDEEVPKIVKDLKKISLQNSTSNEKAEVQAKGEVLEKEEEKEKEK